MRMRGIREEHVEYVLNNGEFIRYNNTGTAELWGARILDRWIVVVIEMNQRPYKVRTA